MTERTHEELQSLVAAYVIGAVPPDEVGAVRNHILTCDECMAEADQHTGAMDSLALAVEPVPLPAGFSDRVMAQIAPVSDAWSPSPAAAPARRSLPGWLRGRGLALAGGLAAFVLLGVLGAGWLQTHQDLARTEDIVSALVHGEGIELRGESGAAAELVPTNEGAVMAVAGLPEAPGSHVYQLWYMKDGTPVSVGTFETRDSIVVMELAERFDGYQDAAITIEPRGGSQQPTSDPVLSTF